MRSARRQRADSGAVLVYILLFALLVTVVITALIAADGSRWTPGVATTAVVCLALSMFAIVVEARRDLDALLTFLAVFAGGVAIFASIYLLNVDAITSTAAFVTGSAWATALGFGATLLARRNQPENRDFPDYFRAVRNRAAILERDGIQAVVGVERGQDGAPHQIVFVLQNCFDEPRQVAIAFHPGSNAKWLRLHPEIRVELGGGEVVEARAPVITPTYPGDYELPFDWRVSGAGGDRVRFGKATPLEARTRPWQRAILLLGGHLSFGGGASVRVGALHSDLWTAPLPPAQQRSLWQPLSLPMRPR